jgi:GT2 family glycosyltransferase
MYLSFIIVNYNVKYYVIDCIRSIEEYCSDLRYELIIVDNHSTDGSNQMFSSFQNVNYHYLSTNIGFGRANNIGANLASGDLLVFVNPDVVLTKLTKIHHLIELCKNDNHLGLLSCTILNSDGSVQSIGYPFPTLWQSILRFLFFWDTSIIKGFRYRNYICRGIKKVDGISGAFFITRKAVFMSVNGFDKNLFLDTEDIDISASIKNQGFSNYVIDTCSVIHHHGKSKSMDFTPNLLNTIKKIRSKSRNLDYVLRKNEITKLPGLVIFLYFCNSLLLISIAFCRRLISTKP